MTIRPSTENVTTTDNTVIVCSSCFDVVGERILAIIPQSTCAICEKKCLGYKTPQEVR